MSIVFTCNRIGNVLNVRSGSSNEFDQYFVLCVIYFWHVLKNVKINFMFFALVKMYYAVILDPKPKKIVHFFYMLLGRGMCNIICFGDDGNNFYCIMVEGLVGTILFDFCLIILDFTRKNNAHVNLSQGDGLTARP